MSEPLSKTGEKNLRRGVKMWGAVPTPGDVGSMFATIDALRDELATAEKEATRLSNYETAYNNLRLLTRSQYDDIDSLTGERNEARRKLTMCSETLRDVDEVKETAQRELAEALADIDEMRAEGCAAVGVLENIFNGVTAEGVNHGDRTIAKTASVAAEALVNVPRCEHKEELDEALRLLKAVKHEIDADAHLKCLLCYGEGEHCEDCPASAIDAFLSDEVPPDPGDDPDRKYDEERDRRRLGKEE